MQIICMMDFPLEKEASKRRKDVSAAGFDGVTINPEACEASEEIEKHIKQSAQDGAKYVVIPPVFHDDESNAESVRDKEFYQSIAPVAVECGVEILIPNCFKTYNGHWVRGEFSNPKILMQFVDELNQAVPKNVFGVCVDTGVCNICGQNPYEFVHALGGKVSAVLVRTNDGQSNASALPFMGAGKSGDCFEWKTLVCGLREIGFSGPLIMDYRSQSRGVSHLIRGQVDVLAKKIADYLVWQIEMESTIRKYPTRVLFGAGNMCRNYMKCYSEKYPPLFTCDNNSRLWGAKFEGLEVKDPAMLKEIPEDCAIFICNIYYREIEAQLREMGIRNPIEFFNDEYMPSFYFDRI